MQKNWLIRTKSNHILGPVSKEKVLELYHNGSIRQEDEICSGNGYWFYLREKDQLERYLLGNQKQSFNPISEARDVLTADLDSHEVGHDEQDDITMVGGIDISSLKDDPPPPPVAAPKPTGRAPAIDPEKKNEILADDLSTESVEETPVPVPPKPRSREVAPTPTPVAPGRAKKGTTIVPPPRVVYVPKARLISDKVVMMGAFVILLVLASMLYFRKRLLKEIMPTAISIVVPTAYAQSTPVDIKKKVFLSQSR
jgi:hypothetical protein